MKAPSWARALLYLLVPSQRREDVLGDLNEAHRRRRLRLGGWRAWLGTSLDALAVAGAFLLCRCSGWRINMKNWMSRAEVRLGLRLIRKQPLMALTVVLALAVGIALATIGFTLREAVLTEELPFETGDRFVLLRILQEPGGERMRLDLERYRLFQRRATTLEHLGALRGTVFNILHPSGEVEPVQGAWLTPRSFQFLPFQPVAGRKLIPSDGKAGAPPVALIRESLWERRYQRDPQLIGRPIELAGMERTVVGVMPDSFEFPTSGEVWLPLDDLYLGGPENGPAPFVRAFGVLAPGASPATAQQQLQTLSGHVALQRPSEPQLRMDLQFFPQAMVTGRFDIVITVLVTVLVLVLLVIASNVANLFLARNSSRASELAVRTALGASRGRLVGQLFVEVLLLGAIAALLGMSASSALMGWAERTIVELPFWIDFTPNLRTMLFVALVTLLASAVGGVLPALKSTRRDPASTLQSVGRDGALVGLGRLGAVMIVLEMALSVALLSGAVVMAQAFAVHWSRDFGLAGDRILTASVYVEPAPSETLAARQLAVIRAARELPGASAGGASSYLPRLDPAAQPVVVEPAPGQPEMAPMPAPIAAAQPGFFEALGVRASAGRLFSQADVAPGAPPVAVVNQPFIVKFLQGRNPIGRRLRAAQAGREEPSTEWREIVGVVADLGLSTADQQSAAGYYIPMPMGRDRFFYLALGVEGDPNQLSMPLRRAIAEVDPSIRLSRVMPLDQVGAEERAFFSVMGSSLLAMGGMALLLSLMGIYAIMSFTVTTRTREIGVRLALGAAKRQVLWPVVGRSSAYLATGALLGCLLGRALMEARGLFMSRLPRGEPWVFLTVLILMTAAGLVACWIPARRALSIHPAKALRE